VDRAPQLQPLQHRQRLCCCNSSRIALALRPLPPPQLSHHFPISIYLARLEWRLHLSELSRLPHGLLHLLHLALP
jgi:hypothetical protein